jgi:hypothetical protein
MQCPEFESALQEAADRRELLGAESDGPHADGPHADGPRTGTGGDWHALRRHADACPRCRSLWRQFHFLDDALRGWGRQTFDVRLTDAVMAHWRRERDENRAIAATATEPTHVGGPGRSGRRLWAAVCAVAVAALLAVLIGSPRWFDPNETAGRPDPPGASDQPAQPAPRVTPDASPDASPDVATHQSPDGPEPVPWGSLVENAGTAYRIVADDTAETWTGVKQLVSAWTPADMADMNDMTDESAPPGTTSETGGAQPWLDDLRRDLRPVGRDMTRPLEFLREALPGSSATL